MSQPIRPQRPLVSLVVPVYNEQDAVPLFVRAIDDALAGQGIELELLFVDDGSTDQTLPLLVELSERDARVRVVGLSRNFGKEAALTAGLDHASGDVVIPMDVDLQDPPALIPKFLERWREGYDVVYGWRTSRPNDSIAKRWSAAGFYRVFNRVAHTQIPENAGDFRLIDRRVVDVIRRLPERNRFMKGLFAWVGFRSIAVPYERPRRAAGKTSFNHWRLWNFALDGLVSFSSLPLHLWTYVGFSVAATAFLYGSFIVLRTLVLGIDVPGYASLITIMLFLGGVQLVSIGVLGEYLSRVFTEVKGRPVYLVDTIHGRVEPRAESPAD